MSHPWPGISQTNVNMSAGGGQKGTGGAVTADIGFESTVKPRCNVDKLTICKQGPASVLFTHRTQTLSWGIYSRPRCGNMTAKRHAAIKFLSHRSRPPSQHSQHVWADDFNLILLCCCLWIGKRKGDAEEKHVLSLHVHIRLSFSHA